MSDDRADQDVPRLRRVAQATWAVPILVMALCFLLSGALGGDLGALRIPVGFLQLATVAGSLVAAVVCLIKARGNATIAGHAVGGLVINGLLVALVVLVVAKQLGR